jgi:hypothetical protein
MIGMLQLLFDGCREFRDELWGNVCDVSGEQMEGFCQVVREGEGILEVFKEGRPVW